MDWTAPIDSYYERLDPSFWAEPSNAVTNAAFLGAALWMWLRMRGLPAVPGLGMAKFLCVVLALIGIGSFLFHTEATGWAVMADTVPIAVYVLLYIFAANRFYWDLSVPEALGSTALFFPYAALTIPLISKLPVLGVSAGYMSLPVMILAYAVTLRHKLPQVAQGPAIGGGILLVSLTFRSLDMPLCTSMPFGTHFLWHLLNALMLGWMIEVLRRHLMTARLKAQP